MKIPARRCGPCVAALQVSPFGAYVVARPGRQGVELDAVLLVRLLHTGGAQVVQDHRREVLRLAIATRRLGGLVNQLAVLVHAQYAVGRQAFHGERPGHAHRALFLIGLVVQVLEVGLGGDGRVYLLLARNARFPEFGQRLMRGGGPVVRAARAGLPILRVSVPDHSPLTTDHGAAPAAPHSSPKSRRFLRCWRWRLSVTWGTRS